MKRKLKNEITLPVWADKENKKGMRKIKQIPN